LLLLSGTIAGGLGAELTGGNFWQGAATGLMVSGLNHFAHQIQNILNLTDEQIRKIYESYPNANLEDPNFISKAELFKMIGGDLYKEYLKNPKFYQDTCAIRLSYALNESGVLTIPSPAEYNATFSGSNGKFYFIKADAMTTYLSKPQVWGNPILLKNNQILKNGVYTQSRFSAGTTGHIDIMYRKNPGGHFYNVTTYYWH